jgi:type I restriction enzyme S subunit
MSKRCSVQLCDVISVKHGFAFPGDGFTDDPSLPTLVTPGNFAIGGGFKPSNPKTFRGSFPEEYRLAPGDLIITMTDLSREGATLGLPAVVPAEGTYLHNQRIGLVQIHDSRKVEREFLHYYLRTNGYRAHILGTATGSTVRHTSPTKVCSFVADLPSADEQRAIAEVLGALDDKIAANTKLAEVAEKLALVEFLKAIQHQSYEVVLAEVTSLLARGITPKYAESGECVVVLNQKCIRDQRVNFDPARTSSRDRLRAEKVLLPDDVLVNSTGQGTLGRVARWTQDREATVDSHVSIVRFDESLIDPVCGGFGVLRLQSVIEQMGEGSTGQTELSRAELGKLRVRLPHREAQTTLRSRLAMLGRQSNVQLAENRALVALRDALLPQLMSGNIRVKDVEKAVGEVL